MALVCFQRIHQLSDLSRELNVVTLMHNKGDMEHVGRSSENLSARNTVALSICHAFLRDIVCSQNSEFSARLFSAYS
jgi:hypothetical protein